ncbi:MAG: hypothetical protein FLDDKLPJ_01872 [Phycisphaerae bacterium]|nr:hypothetical protein [Phycisphaerae bacterium]
MTFYFADSYYYLALLNPADEDHARVVQRTRGLKHSLVTSTWVLTEVADAFALPAHRAAFVRLVETLRADDKVTVVKASQDLFDRGVELYRKRTDKRWSLTDCISFTVMEQMQIREALTADHHFEQAGFVALLK